MIANEPDPPAPSSDAARGAPVCNLVARTHRRGRRPAVGQGPNGEAGRLRQRVGIGPSIEPGARGCASFCASFCSVRMRLRAPLRV
jgi:hypothetical protein